MHLPISKERTFSNFIPSTNSDHFKASLGIKRTQSSIKFGQPFGMDRIEQNNQQVYLTPNMIKMKFMCRNHMNRRGTHFYQTKEGERIHYCLECSNEIARQGFSVKTMIQNGHIYKNQSQKKFQPKRFDFIKKKQGNDGTERVEWLKVAERGISQLERRANLQILKIDEEGGRMLEELSGRFNEVMGFLQEQKESCIELIFEQIDGLKRPFQEMKNMLANERWEVENIKSRLNLLAAQEGVPQIRESLGAIQKNQLLKVEKIIQKKSQLERILQERILVNRMKQLQSLGTVQQIIQSVYSNYLTEEVNDQTMIVKDDLSSDQDEVISRQIIIGKQAVSEFPSPIKMRTQLQESQHNETLKQEIQNIQTTINNEPKSQSWRYFMKSKKAQINHKKTQTLPNTNTNPFNLNNANQKEAINNHTNKNTKYFPESIAIKKRPSQATTVASFTNLRS